MGEGGVGVKGGVKGGGEGWDGAKTYEGILV